MTDTTTGTGTITHSTRYVGADLPRKEDPALVRGSVVYVDDVQLPGMLHAAVLRSPHAHARIVSIDTSEARALPGVHAVLTGEEALDHIGPLARFCAEEVVEHAIAVGKVRYHGEAVVAVAAESRYVAEDALAKVRVEYEPLPVVTDVVSATAEGAPLVHENLESNVVYHHEFAFGDVEGDFAGAAHIVRRELRWPRATAAPMETNGAVVKYDPATGRMDVWSNTNLLNFGAWVMSATLRVAPHMLNFHPMAVGGSFGSKHFLAKQVAIAGALAKATGCPVKFMEDRADNLLASDAQGPERQHVAELALDADGTFRSLRIRLLDDYGAYFMLAIAGNTNPLSQIVGPYRIRSVSYDVSAVLTNKNQQGVFRGAGADVTNWVLERLVDAAADELGFDPIDLRRRNLIQPDQFPYKIPTGNSYDSGNYPAVLARALELADIDHWRAEQERAREQGRYIGIGIATAQQRSTYYASEFWFHNVGAPAPFTTTAESVRLRIGPTGGVTATLFTPSWGNSQETVTAQLIAAELGVDPAGIAVDLAPTMHGLPSAGPGGSRMTVMLSGAITGAARKLREKIFQIAAHRLEASVDDLELRDGVVSVRGTDSQMTLADIGMQAYWQSVNLPPGMESGLEATFTYDPPFFSLPNDERTDLGNFYPIVGHGCHVVVVEVDPETGQIDFLRYVAVHDHGTVVNPRSLEGQIRGGIAQGIGIALYEQVAYDSVGQNLAGSLDEYVLPGAPDVPRVEIAFVETPSPWTAHGVKGGGEGGRMIAPPAVTRAVEDALLPFGARFDALPIRREDVVELCAGESA
ncbi:xanthine dehydrogenase family protein molybdopterin-binding subunit [Pseudonocardia thermophila]|jgi:Aerobic-type carbon monoxide dehydrogenase, large subunit CoxL/CutL homologs|uniref:xanthine dehydrogenase family protein molybdopterin-binding subunit n=1 Tax=Pseudonocardia thermophila TaxID=1848 RepID=UPI00248D889B|nr:xanthine dehydrogenase family protein molybdopterin-binding subunit [Pseudonocardia thermophila]